MPVDLLGHVPEEGQTAVLGNRGGQGTKHRRGEVLAFVDHHVTIAARLAVRLELRGNGLGDVVPVVQLALSGSDVEVLPVGAKENGTLGPHGAGAGPADAFRLGVLLGGPDAVLRDPGELVHDELDRPLEYGRARDAVPGLLDRPAAKGLLLVGFADRVVSHLAARMEVAARELVVVEDIDAVDASADAVQVGDQTLVERQQQGRTAVIDGGVGKMGGTMNGQGRLSTPGRTQHDGMSLRGQEDHFPLATFGFRKARVHRSCQCCEEGRTTRARVHRRSRRDASRCRGDRAGGPGAREDDGTDRALSRSPRRTAPYASAPGACAKRRLPRRRMPLTHRSGRVDGWRGRSPVRCCTSGTLARGCCRSESRPLPRANRRFAPAASWLYSVRLCPAPEAAANVGL